MNVVSMQIKMHEHLHMTHGKIVFHMSLRGFVDKGKYM
jgi:hypothetical protein